jgi:Zn-dependent M28 family amino/carboxypeptidase
MPTFDHLDVQLVLFDAEDGGRINGGDWIVGSTYFAEQMDHEPDAVIVVDMIGDADQAIYLEKNSDPFLAAEIWGTAEDLGVDTFIFEEKYSMLDDHTPFVSLGIPSVLLIDFDYPYWHTTADTLDKISSESLQNVGDVLLEWLNRIEQRAGN